jgi:hypothetical protein
LFVSWYILFLISHVYSPVNVAGSKVDYLCPPEPL